MRKQKKKRPRPTASEKQATPQCDCETQLDDIAFTVDDIAFRLDLLIEAVERLTRAQPTKAKPR
jgi:hypothetical protein